VHLYPLKQVKQSKFNQTVSPKRQQNKQAIQVGTDCASLSSQAGEEVKVTRKARNDQKLKIEKY